MRASKVLFAALALALLAIPVTAHEPKEYTMLLKEEGVTPSGVQYGILVSSDYLFFYNVDTRENTSHRILIDADSDGSFDGSDDISTPWLYSSCVLNETGQRDDPDCQVTELVLLDPSNGLIPGNISMMHQVLHNGEAHESVFIVSFSADDHSMQPVQNSESEQEADTPPPSSLLKSILLFSIIGMVVLFPKLLSGGR